MLKLLERIVRLRRNEQNEQHLWGRGGWRVLGGEGEEQLELGIFAIAHICLGDLVSFSSLEQMIY